MSDNRNKSREELITELQQLELKYTALSKKYKIEVESQEKEKQGLNKLNDTTKELIQYRSENTDYGKITQSMLEIAGAKYCILNIFDENGLGFRTVAVAGIEEKINEVVDLLGFNIKNKKWENDPQRDQKIQNQTITKFKKLHDLTGSVISKNIILVLEKIFNIGETVIVKIEKDNKVLGDFTLFFENNKTLENEKLVELNAHQVGVFLNRIKITENVLASELKLRTITDVARDAIIMIDSEGLISYWNPAAEEILGYTKAEVIGKNLHVLLMPPQYYDAHHAAFPLFQKTGKGAAIGKTLELEARRKDGIEISIHLSLSAIQIDNSWHAVGIIRDITERKKAEETMLNLSQAVEQSPVSILITDTDGNIEYGNSFLTELTGYSLKDLLGENPRIFSSGRKTKEEYKQLWNTIKSGEKWQGEFLNKKINGELYWESASIAPIKNKKGEIVRFLALKEDITQRKLAEKKLQESEIRFHSLFDNMNEGVALHKLIYKEKKPVNYRIIDVNNGFEKITGISREEIKGKLGTDAFNTNTPPYFEEYTKVNSGKIPVYFETFYKELNKHFAISVTSWQKNGFATIFTDISERKIAEEKLKLTNTELQKINAEKDKFFSIIAHDLRSPFNSIFGFSEVLAEEAGEKNYKNIEKYAGLILKSSEHAMDLLTNLMEWAQSQTGRMNFKPEYIDIIKLTNEIISQLENTALQKSINIETNLNFDSDIFADKAMLSTILRNIISNAIKFTNPGGKILINTEQNEAELTFSVHDNGIGISKDQIRKLFQIDKNYSTPGTLNEKGTGLGLILCKEFIGKHGGIIWVESKEGQGSVFNFTLPCQTKPQE